MNDPRRLLNRYLAVAGDGEVQVNAETGVPDADIDTRHACEITMEEVVIRNDTRDCRGQDLINQNIRTRGLRFTFNYTEVTPHILNLWKAWFLGASANPTGTPANEVQTVTVAGDGTIAMTLEGRTVTTKTIESTGITAAILQAALTAASMGFIQPGDAVVTGAGPFTVTFPDTGRLGRANLPTMVGTGGISVVAGTNGAQNFHALTRSVDNDKLRLSFVIGWDTDADRAEKYVGYAVESYTETWTRRQNVTLQVSVIGPWEPEILTAFPVPVCVNIKPLLTDDCKLLVNNIWETTDVQTCVITLNDAVATDESSAYGFDSVDIQDLERGDQPTYGITASIFGSELDGIYVLAFNERTQVPVDVKAHAGQPGNRSTLLAPVSKIKFQNNRMGSAGTLRKSTINLDITPFGSAGNAPVSAEGYDNQGTAFLTT